ncbi:hypothetical protein EIN_263430 [Entamoeba invadens IP1]|uniref:Leucine rich repeat containing protein BspA family protein n=1 Tax=Entamoeba invadens IP1 TaxID=370355 RepID=L7FP39_ENTIV|nr:hypothetical protein EIN_263430 [Entamoeba invadens IP1]ELP92959.1 hypothetical protein EIN_263430 [Entamoeba invadens IP1]|eukprot:XP_004259730.1 hypothetical protein EIN_263430 [Entamoeba invadens IP1]
MAVQLDRYSMMIVSKYFNYISDYINMVFVCKKLEEIPEMFHFNPISVSFITQKYFPNVETLHLYTEKDKFLSKYRQYYVHYPTPLHKCIKLNQGKHVICPLRTFRFDSQHYGCSYKDANIFLDKAVKNTSAKLTAMDCSNIVKFGLSCFEFNTLLVSITLSSNLYEIPYKCFFLCANLKEINLEHIRVFGNYCFCRCNSLSAITLGTNIIKSAKYAFDEVTSIKNVTAPGVKSVDFDITASSSKAFLNIKHKTITIKEDYTNFILPDFLSDEIQSNVYVNKRGLSDINLASTVTTIRIDALSGCDLKRLDLSHVISFGTQRFMTCLTAITLNSNVKIDNLYDYTGLKKIDAINTKVINVRAACWMKAMLDAKNLEINEFCYTQQDVDVFKGIIPLNIKNLRTIISDANFENYKYEEMTIPEGITNMSINAFKNNEKLRKLVFPASFPASTYFTNTFTHATIEELCIVPNTSLKIKQCDKLTSVTFIDQNITNNCVLNECFNIKNIDFLNIPSNFVFEGSVNYYIYKVIKNKYTFKGDVVLYYIDMNSIDCNGVLIIPDEVTVIDQIAFKLSNLKEVWMGANVKMIKMDAFSCCPHLTRAKNMNRSTVVQRDAFYKFWFEVTFIKKCFCIYHHKIRRKRAIMKTL